MLYESLCILFFNVTIRIVWNTFMNVFQSFEIMPIVIQMYYTVHDQYHHWYMYMYVLTVLFI